MAELIVNGNFESGNTSGWSDVQSQNSFISDRGYNSSYSFAIGNYTTFSKLFQQTINTIVGESYSLSYVLKNPSNSNFKFDARINDNVITGSSINSSIGFDWTSKNFSFVASTTSTIVSFFAKIDFSHPSYCYVDNISVIGVTFATITNFSIPTKIYGNTPFTIAQPTSNSSGSFSYTSSNPSVATISGNIITIVGAGNSTITATQSATANYTSGTITTTFQVNQSTPTNPVIINNSDELLYFMNTTSTYSNIINDLEINYHLITSSYKTLTGNNIKITNQITNFYL